MAVLSGILRDNRYEPADIPDLESKLFFEGDRSRRYLVRFTVLLFLSIVIAANGVIEDPSATVAQLGPNAQTSAIVRSTGF